NMNRESVTAVKNGWLMLPLNIVLLLVAVALFISGVVQANRGGGTPAVTLIIVAVLMFITACVMFGGFFTLQPNQARVLVLFGEYRGTVRESGFHWGNPFYSNGPLSLRAIAEAGKSGDK